MATHCYSDAGLLRCGSQDGFLRTKGGLAAGGKESGIFVSQVYDSGREGTQWNHLRLDVDRNGAVEVFVWLFDRLEEYGEKLRQEDIRRWFGEKKVSAGYASCYRNMLLYGHGGGRYARIAVEILPGDGNDVVFGGYDLSFPKESFAEYLPVIYQNNIQLDRFLAVQQYIYLEMEEKVDHLAEKLDYELCSRKQLVRLAEWLGWGELAWQADRDTLEKLMRAGIALAGKKGTCGYYLTMTEILIGQKAAISEEPESSRAVVLILGEPEKGKEKHLEWLKKNVPIGIEIEFVILRKTQRLDGQYFLDHTSYLSEYESELTEYGCPIENMRLL